MLCVTMSTALGEVSDAVCKYWSNSIQNIHYFPGNAVQLSQFLTLGQVQCAQSTWGMSELND